MAKAVAIKEAEDNKQLALIDDANMPTGFENDTAEDFQTPYMAVLQGLSKRLESVDGAKPGLIINTATDELLPDGFNFVICKKARAYVRRKPNQGPVVAAYKDASDPVVAAAIKRNGGNEYGALKTEDGDDLQDTVGLTGIVVSDDGQTPLYTANITFKSTGLKSYKKWNSLCGSNANRGIELRGKPLPKWAVIYHLGVFKEQNEKGTFYNFKVDTYGKTLQEAIVQSADLYNAIKACFNDPKATVNFLKLPEAVQQEAGSSDSEAM